MRDHYITLNGLQFHYLEWPHDGAPDPSTGSGQAMLLVHGFAGNALTWDVFAAAMAKQFRVIALDQRGHGDSEWADEYGTEHAVADLHAFISALDLHNLVLVGHSMGGRNSIVYLNRHPECVSQFIIIDTGPEMNPAGGRRIMGGWQNSQDVFDSREQAFEQLRAVNQRPPLEHHRTRVYHGLKQLPDGQWTWKYDVKLRRGRMRPPTSAQPTSVRPPPQSARGGSPDGMAVDDWWRMWAAIPCPTLLVRGGVSDLLTHEGAEQMAAANPHCTFVEIVGAGHSVPMDRPVEFEQAVATWLGVTTR